MEVAELFATLGLQANEGQWKRGQELIGGMRTALGFFVAWEGVKFFAEMVESVTQAAIGAERLSQKLGVSTEDVQRLGYAARVSGVEAEQLQVGMQKLAKGLEEARTKGSGPVAETFAKLGISMNDPLVKSKDLGETILVVAEKFKAMPDDARKTALAIELFGRSGTALIPMLNEGKDGIVAFMKEADQLGIVLTQDDAKAFEKFEQDQVRLKATWEGLRNTAVKALLPMLQELVTNLLEWVKANREAIASTLKTVLEGLVIAVKAVGYAFQGLVAVIDFFKEHTELAQAILIALGVVIAAFAVEAAVSWVIAFWPVVLVIAIITAVILVVMDLWKSITTGKGVAASVFRWIARQAEDFWEGLKAIGEAIGGFFADVGRGIRDAFVDAFNFVIDKAKDFGDTLSNLPAIKQLTELGHFIGGGVYDATHPDEAAVVQAPAYSGASGVVQARGATTVNVSAPVTINAQNADAQQVQKMIEEHHEQVVRDVYSGTGGGDLVFDASQIPGGQ